MSLSRFILNPYNAVKGNNNIRLVNFLYYYFLSLSPKYSALIFKCTRKLNRHMYSEMLLHHIASALSDTVSTKVISKYFVCCLFTEMLDYYNSE